jgi:hypothetical protein
MKRNPDKMGFSEDEGKKFGTAFEDPEFRRMFSEYMDELSDPAHRAETEAYISQLEGENKVPAGKELIRPTMGFVAKTYKVDEKQKDQKGDKIWMNIVVSEKIMKPSSEKTPQGESWSVPYSLGPPHMEKDNTGSNVATFDCCFHPEALAKSQQRKAFQNLLVQTAMEGVEESYKRQKLPTTLLKDFHVLKGVNYKSGVIGTMLVDKAATQQNWDTTTQGSAQSAVNDLASKLTGQKTTGVPEKISKSREDIAAAVEKAKAEQLAKSTASSTSPKGKKAGGIIKKGFLDGRGGSAPTPKNVNPLIQEISSSTTTTKSKSAMPPTPPMSEADELAAKSVAEVKSVSNAAKIQREKLKSNGGSLEPTKTMLETDSTKAPTGPIEPKYTVVERGLVDWGDFELSSGDGGDTTNGSRGTTKSLRPKELVIRIELPRVAAGQTGHVELDVAEKRVSLKYKDVYNVAFTLPYRVDDKKGSAKFEKVKQALVVTLPLAKPTEEEVKLQAQQVEAARNAASAIKEVKAAESAAINATSSVIKKTIEVEKNKVTKQSSPSKSKSKEKDKVSPYTSGLTDEEKKESASLKQEIAKAAAAAKEQAIREANDPTLIAKKKEAAELALKKKEEAKAAAAAKALEASKNVANIDTSTPFIAAVAFNGKKEGYVFKRSDLGLGYHVDVVPSKAVESTPTSTPAPASTATTKIVETKPTSIKTKESEVKVKALVPTFQMKQTTQAVSVMVPLTGIDKASVNAVFDIYSVKCSFKASDNMSYAFELNIPEYRRKKQSFEIEKCKYDVAKKNMVIVLVKSSTCAAIWNVDGGDDKIMSLAPWVDSSSAVELSSESKNAKSPKKQSDDVKIVNLVREAQNMKFNQNSNAIFDLD